MTYIPNTYVVYKTTNTITGEYYIGESKNWKTRLYLGSGQNIKKAIRHFGYKAFSKQILAVFRNKKEACEVEAKLINIHVDDPRCYNKKLVGKVRSAEHCLNLSKALTGRKLSETHRANLLGKRGTPGVKREFSEAHRAALSKALKGNPKLRQKKPRRKGEA